MPRSRYGREDQAGDEHRPQQAARLGNPLARHRAPILSASGVNPGDIKKRAGWLGSPMPYPRVIPHSDGAGTIDAVGSGVPASRIGERVFSYGAQSYRPFGTAAQWVTVPSDQAVRLPDEIGFEIGACLGISGITAHRAVFCGWSGAGSYRARRRSRRRVCDATSLTRLTKERAGLSPLSARPNTHGRSALWRALPQPYHQSSPRVPEPTHATAV